MKSWKAHSAKYLENWKVVNSDKYFEREIGINQIDHQRDAQLLVYQDFNYPANSSQKDVEPN